METIDQTVLRLQTFIRETYPDVDLGPGSVLNELVVKLACYVQNDQYNNIAALEESSSILTVLSSTEPDALPTDVIDRIASNYFVTRNTGAKSTGKIRVQVTVSRNYSLPQNFTFTQPSTSLNYKLPAAVTVSPNPSTGQIQLQSNNGLFYFIVDVEAAEVGTQYQVNDRTTFAIGDSFNISNFVKAEAYGNFTSGVNEQTNTELISELRLGMSTKTMTSPVSVESNLKENFPAVRNVALIGVGDPEMNRASFNVFSLNIPGYVDVYIRSTFGMEEQEVTKAVSAVDSSGNSEFVLNYTDTSVAGFYRVSSILPLDSALSGSFEIVSVTYSYELPPANTRVNFVNDNDDARFTMYQKATVVFKNTSQASSVRVRVVCQRDIFDIQQLLLSSSQRIPCADYLARSVLPCFVNLTLPIIVGKGVVLDEAALREEVFNYINSIPVGESLNVSRIVNICHGYNIKRVDLPLTVKGEVLGLDSSVTYIQNSDILTIPTNLTKGISPNTTMFFVGMENIGITIGQ